MTVSQKQKLKALRNVLVVALIAGVTGCSTVKGWMNKLGSTDTVHQPTPLTAITPSISVQRLWSRSVGKGERLLGLRDRPAIDGGHVYVEEAYGPNMYALDLASGRDL